VTRAAPGPLPLLRSVLETREPAVLATVIASDDPTRAPLGDHPDVTPSDTRRLLATRRIEQREESTGRGRVVVLLEPVAPPVPLLVLGAGPDAAPLVRIAAGLGWDVRVWDARAAFAHAASFPEAREVICCPPAEASSTIQVDANTVAIVMTHHYLHDRVLLGWLVPSPVRYLGILGPRQRTDDLLQDLATDGVTPSDAQLERLHAPAGLDIGADGAEEIALAVVAEIRSVLAGRPGGGLRERKGPIHDLLP
jgi:xanthine dehydrogenase accessory factor